MYNAATSSAHNVINRLAKFIAPNGPENNQFDELNNLWNDLQFEENTNAKAPLKARLQQLFADDFLFNFMKGSGTGKNMDTQISLG